MESKVTLPQVEIGQHVQYFINRPNVETGENNFIDGNGTVTALFLNPDKRRMVQVKDGANMVNVELACVDASEETKAAYMGMVETVDALTKEGNEAVRKVADGFNESVQMAYNIVLGVPVDVK